MRYHFVYKMTNNVNNKIYVGVHSTDNINDGYMGSGKSFINALRKYGRESFRREILGFFYTRQAAYSEEERIVDSDFIKREDTYNIVVGGGIFGRGPDHPLWGRKQSPEWIAMMIECNRNRVWTEEQKANMSKIMSGENHPMWGRKRPEKSNLKLIYTRASINPLLNGHICNLILEKRKNGLSFYRIAKDLNEMGIEKVSGGSICRGTLRWAYKQILKLQSIGYYEQSSDFSGA